MSTPLSLADDLQKAVQQVESFEDGESGADQGDELLVEDEELLQVQLLTAKQGAAYRVGAGLDRVDQEALLGILVAEFLLGSRGGHLVVDLPTSVCVLQDKIRHGYCPVSTICAPLGA